MSKPQRNVGLGDENIRILQKVRERSPSTKGGGGGTFDPMEARVRKLEDDMTDIKVLLARIDERTSALSTKTDVADVGRRLGDKIAAVDTRVGVAEGELRRTLGVWQFVGIMAMAVGLITQWPKIAVLLGV